MTAMTSLPTGLLRRLTSVAPTVATCGALLSACLALLGYALLGFLFMTRYYAPASHHYVRPLHFDYTGSVAEAVAPLSPNLREQSILDSSTAITGGATAVLPKSRFLPTGSQVAVHVCLFIPWDHTDLFQVTGELLTNSSHVAARSARTFINTRQPYAYRLARQLMFLPVHVLGWGHGDWVLVDLPLFNAYEEREDAPVTLFRARLASRTAAGAGIPPPPVHKAEVHVRLRLGFVQTALFWLRPGLVTSVVVLLLGLSTAVGGTTGTLVLAVVAYMLRRWVRKNEELARKRRGGALPLGAPPSRQKGHPPPYGSLEDAMSYSLAHAQYVRESRRRESYMGADEGDQDADGGRHHRQGHAGGDGMSRQGSEASQRGTQHETDDTSSHNVHYSPPGWSGSSTGPSPSGDACGTGPNADGTPSRQGSGAAAEPPKWPGVPGAVGRAGSGLAERLGSSTAVGLCLDEQGDDESDEDSVDVKVSSRRGCDSVKRAGSSMSHAAGLGGEGFENEHGREQEQKVAYDPTEPSGASEEGVGLEQEAEEEDVVKEGGKAGSDAGEPMHSDLDPQADTPLRRRGGFAWKA